MAEPMKPTPKQAPDVFAESTDADDRRAISEILASETVGGALMLLATVAALVWANFFHESYDSFRHIHLGPMSLQHWAADGLLTIFFFVAGMELKREFTSGSLRNPTAALVPIVAAVAGMLVPAGVYLAINLLTPGGRPEGWAIPMATDIAFALAILAAVGSRLPASLRAFLLTLAIVDDLGAIIVIALVFTADLAIWWLLGAVVAAAAFWALQRVRWWPTQLLVPVAVVCWWCTYQSGVHATIAGVLLGLLCHSTPDDKADSVDRWQHFWHPISSTFAVPAFALLSAGVVLYPSVLAEMATSPFAWGIVLGLLVGKPIGVVGGAWLTARFTRANLAPDLSWRDIAAVGVLAGVGFTVALFISELAFDDPALIDEAKAAVLIGSALAALAATLLLRRRTSRRERAGTLPEQLAG